jgi:hypothetical protein
MIGTIEIPGDIKIYLDEICERLYTAHAAVMVGAGFSKNAEKGITEKKFLSWPELGNEFYKKLYGSLPSEKDCYLNALKLAEEVQAAFGRPVLDKVMRDSLPDIEYNPSKLHKQLIGLPWVDIFTTNYDTLLERAVIDDPSKKYDVVVNKSDLIFSEKPRIIKLHGSFPSDRPFIITEDDYRTYPVKFSPFVNTVQQSLIENSLCMIGFSGDDPNFLNWIGWIRDNLGEEESHKMYLVGVFNLSDPQKKLLAKRNIVVVDMSVCNGIEKDDYYKGLELFFDYLKSKESNDVSRWPLEKGDFGLPHSQVEKEIIANFKSIVTKWGNDRKDYPGWIVAPIDKRNHLYRFTENWTFGKFDLLEKVELLDLHFIYELDWRLQKSLSPIPTHLIEYYAKVVSKYIDRKIFVVDKSFSKSDTIKYFNVCLSLLKYHRINKDNIEWESVFSSMSKNINYLSGEQKACLNYEKCLYSIFNFRLENLKNNLRDWDIDNSQPYWKAKKGALLAEVGEIENGHQMIEEALISIRKRLNLSPVKNDYTLVSEEAYTMQLLKFVKDASYWKGREEKKYDFHADFGDRWNQLKGYECDPWGDLDYFRSRLDGIPKEFKDKEVVHHFEIRRSGITRHLGGSDTEAIVAYNFLNYFEVIGTPFRINNTTLANDVTINAIKRIVEYSPLWALSVFVRLGSSKEADLIFNRKNLSKINQEEIDKKILELLNLHNETKDIVNSSLGWRDQGIETNYTASLPELLSRLVSKASYDVRKKTLCFVKNAYESNGKIHYSGIKKLVERLIISWPVDKLSELVKVIIKEIPLVDVKNVRINHDFVDPITLINVGSKFKLDATFSTDILKVEFDLISSNDSSKFSLGFRRLFNLYNWNGLTVDAEKEFLKYVFRNTDSDGFPLYLDDYYRFVFVDLCTQENKKNLSANYVAYIRKSIFTTRDPSKKSSHFGGRNSKNIQICNEIRYGFQELNLQSFWSSDDAKTLFEKIYNWWNKDKLLLIPHNDEELIDDVLSDFLSTSQSIRYSVIPFIDPDDTQAIDRLYRFIMEMIEKNVPISRLLIHLFDLFKNRKDYTVICYSFIKKSIFSRNFNSSITAGRAIIELLKTNRIKEGNDLVNYLELIRSVLNSRRIPALNAILANLPSLVETEYLELLKDDILLCLDYLVEETTFLLQSDIEESNRLVIRSYAVHLSYVLCKNSKFESGAPDILKKWKDIAHNSDEFIEIRNQWSELGWF